MPLDRYHCETVGHHCSILQGVRQIFEVSPDSSVSAEQINEIAADRLEDMIDGAQERCEGRNCGLVMVASGLMLRELAMKEAYDQLVGEIVIDPDSDVDR
jgi:hypothetical protein